MASTSDQWLNFHHHHHTSSSSSATDQSSVAAIPPHHSSAAPGSSSDVLYWTTAQQEHSTSVSTTTTSPPQLGPEGRVAKPGRRRTRASRRTPTTLLNTDTSNFRAMVQQFTGGPSSSFPSQQQQPPMGLGFGPGRAQMIIGPGLGYPRQQQQMAPLQYANNNSNHSNISSSDGSIINGNLHGMEGLFGAGLASENRSNSNNGGFQF